MKQPMKNMMQKDRFDNLYTPVEAVLPLIDYIPRDKIYWECCDPGNSNITSVLKTAGRLVYSTDIVTGVDFLDESIPFESYIAGFDIIITNPPYSLKNQFLKRAFKIGKPFAFLLPITSLASVTRGKLFKEYGISLVVLDKRIDFTGKGANWFDVGWFLWNIGENNRIYFEKV